MPPSEGGTEVSMAVLAATFTTSIVFFPVTFFSGISKYIFTPLALGVVLSIFASYFFAMTVVPLYCAKFIRMKDEEEHSESESRASSAASSRKFNEKFQAMLNWYEGLAKTRDAAARLHGRLRFSAGVVLVLAVTVPFLGRAYFPRTDPGQFIIDVRMPSGTRLEVSNDYIAKVEDVIRSVVTSRGSGHDRLQHRRLSRPFRDLYHQCFDGYGVCADQPEGRTIASAAMSICAACSEKLSREMPELYHLLPGRRTG